jgi:uncharacterized protein (DUF433 family)
MPDLTPDGILHDRGRGPEFKHTRITVYDIWDHKDHHDPQFIADLFKLSVEEVLVAIRYIEEHKQELMPEYQEMLDAAARGNPPHIRAILAENHKKVLALKRELEAKKRQEPAGETGDARAAG